MVAPCPGSLITKCTNQTGLQIMVCVLYFVGIMLCVLLVVFFLSGLSAPKMAFGKVFSNIMKLCCVTCRDPDRDKELLETFKMTRTDPILQTLGLLLSFFL